MTNIEITNKDLRILKWINSFGFVELQHIGEKFDQDLTSLSRRLNMLIKINCLCFQKIFHGLPGVYSVSSKGAKAASDHLRAVNKINLGTYHHHLQLVGLSLALEQKYSGKFISERNIRHQKGLFGVGQQGHISDGLLQIDQKNIAIELEFSSKSMKRRKSIVNFYLKHFEYDEMWYVCKNDKIIREIKPHVSRMPFIKLFNLETLLERELINSSF